MRPTFSIICFTVLSGIGYGAWFLQGLGWAIGPLCGPPRDADGVTISICAVPFVTLLGFLLAFALVTLGLLASLGHLGQPGRAWRALSQWRSSWLSREGIASLLTFVPFTLIVALEVTWAIRIDEGAVTTTGWMSPGQGMERLLGFTLAIGALLTVFCTANIYASLKPIRAWHDRHVVPAYLLLGLYGGGLLLWAVGTVGWTMGRQDRQILLVGTVVLALAGAWLKRGYWRSIDAQPATSTGHATGLAALGTVRSFEQPHTEDNYLTHEMGFVLARTHARKLRRIALVLAFGLPAVLAALALAIPAIQPFAAGPALASGLAGLFVERWLFFAEAKHTVIAYYAR